MKPEGSLPHLQVPANCLYPINPVHAPRPTSCRSILLLSSHLRLGLQSVHSLKFPLQNLVYMLFSLTGATCSAYHIILDLFIRIMFGEEYRSLNCSLRSFLYSNSLNSPSNIIYDVIQILNIYALIQRTPTRELHTARRYILSVISRQTITRSEGTNYSWVDQDTSSVTCAAVKVFGRTPGGWTE
jgi:hypothetical protein